MTSNPPLLIHSPPFRYEGPQGYLLRLASENMLKLADLKKSGVVYHYESLVNSGFMPQEQLDPLLHLNVRSISERYQHSKRMWNHQHARFCPLCLEDDPYWHAGWEVLFIDACPEHGVWLIDKCSSCGKQLGWQRESLLRCTCGADLRSEVPQECPESSRWLAEVMLGKLLGLPKEGLPAPLQKTDILQTQTLIRYLGSCFQPGARKKPLKIREAGSCAVSWGITSYAAEILSGWPDNFLKLLTRIYKESDKSTGRSLKDIFGDIQDYLYRGMRASAYQPVRDVFNQWIIKDWPGGVAKRNRRLLGLDLRLVEWIPGKLVCDEAGISTKRLERLIKDGLIEAQILYGTTGRKTITVRRDQLDKIKAHLSGTMSIEEARSKLGICKKRMRGILNFLFPSATRENSSPWSPWSVPRAEVDRVLGLTDDLPIVGIEDEGSVTLNHILRYWSWETMDIVGLIEAAIRGEIAPQARVDGMAGISGLVFRETELQAWRRRTNQGLGTWLTIPQVCKILKIKQEIAYQLVRGGFIKAEKLPKLRNGGQRVRKSEVDELEANYVFATEINEKLNTVSSKLKELLARRGITPISGPGVDRSRKLLYARTEQLNRFIEMYRRDGKDSFELQ